MSTHRVSEHDPAASPIATALVWLGGGEGREVGARHERSILVSAGVVVLLAAMLAWLVAAVALAESTSWPVAAVVAATSAFGLLVVRWAARSPSAQFVVASIKRPVQPS